MADTRIRKNLTYIQTDRQRIENREQTENSITETTLIPLDRRGERANISAKHLEKNATKYKNFQSFLLMHA